MKIVALVPVHTSLPVAGLTIGSFLRTHQKHHIEVHVGVHSNYSDYTKDISLFDELSGIAQIHKVDEIDWMGRYNACFFRYSVMHAKNIENLLRKVSRTNFDYAVLLDHDLHVKEDFVSKCVERYPKADLIGSLHDEKAKPWSLRTDLGYQVSCLPKISVWHLVMSKRLVNDILNNPDALYPKELKLPQMEDYIRVWGSAIEEPLFIDTFAEVFHLTMHHKDRNIGIISSEEFSRWVRHFSASSFNYGSRTRGNYAAHIADIEKIYASEFPDGLEEFKRDASASRIHKGLLKGLILIAEQQAAMILMKDVPSEAFRSHEVERLSTSLMTAKAMCKAGGLADDLIRSTAESVFSKEKKAWESFILARGEIKQEE